MRIKLVVTDMDGTLYSWIDYIVPAVEAMVTAVCQATAYPRLKVIQSLKAVYNKYDSNEYPFALQESSLYQDFAEFGSFDKLVIDPARNAFKTARSKYLRPYKTVVDTLKTLKQRGIPVVALTDAPRNPAEQRVKKMHLDEYLTALYTLPGFQFPANAEGEKLVSQEILQKEERGQYRAACPVKELPRDWEKPSPKGLIQICEEHKVAPNEVLLVGDSMTKDIAIAKAVGAIDCWAEYGTYVSMEYRERLDIISAPAITRRHAQSVYESAVPVRATHALSHFGQILQIIDSVSAT